MSVHAEEGIGHLEMDIQTGVPKMKNQPRRPGYRCVMLRSIKPCR